MNHFLIISWGTIRRFIVECDASAATEYAILLALLVLAAIGAVSALGTASTCLFHSAANEAAKSGGNMSGPGSGFGVVVNAGSAP